MKVMIFSEKGFLTQDNDCNNSATDDKRKRSCSNINQKLYDCYKLIFRQSVFGQQCYCVIKDREDLEHINENLRFDVCGDTSCSGRCKAFFRNRRVTDKSILKVISQKTKSAFSKIDILKSASNRFFYKVENAYECMYRKTSDCGKRIKFGTIIEDAEV